jgi:4-diphosphocytidyl-2-C-methyl-D-erythritol kinase
MPPVLASQVNEAGLDAGSLCGSMALPAPGYLRRVMLVFPHAKINLGLNVVRKRSDGYHDLESVFFPVPICDALEAIVDPDLEAGTVIFERTGTSIPGDPAADLCMKAVDALNGMFSLPGLRIHLHKAIPAGAGLGGGSSDATHMLMVLNALLRLELPPDTLHSLASALGSDCPFFLRPTPQLAQGRGELLSDVRLDMKGLWLVLVNPGVHIATAEVFKNTKPTGRSVEPQDILLHAPMEQWDTLLPNSLEPYVLEQYPAVARVKDGLHWAGAAYTAMSGSGSTVFGFFKGPPPSMKWPDDHTQWTFEL